MHVAKSFGKMSHANLVELCNGCDVTPRIHVSQMTIWRFINNPLKTDNTVASLLAR